MSRSLLLCAGSLTLDNVITADGARLPRSFGGNVIYSALGARLWHEDIGIVSRAGRDFPDECLIALTERGLDVAGVARLDAAHGMNVAFCYAPDGSRVRAFPPEVIATIPDDDRARFRDYTTFGAAHRFAVWTAFAPDGSEAPPAWLDRLTGLHQAAMPVARQQAIATRVRAASDAWIQVDSPWYDERELARDEGSALFAKVDAMLPSEEDVAKAAPDRTLEATVEDMRRRGARRVIVKRGGKGCRLYLPNQREPVDLPALADSSVVDLTGAGDAFCGGFLAGIHLTGDPLRAALFGTVSASFAIGAVGFQGLLDARHEEARARLERLSRSLIS